MNLQRLAYFAAVAKNLSFSRAAEQCFVTQVTVTQQVKQLEDELGVRLFDRTNRKVSLTPAGEVLYGEAQKIFDLVSIAQNRTRNAAEGEAGTVRVALARGSDTSRVIEWLRVFEDAHPGVKVVCDACVTPEAPNAVESRRFDVACAYDLGLGLPEGVARTVVETMTQHVVVSNKSRLAQYVSLGREQLVGETFVTAAESADVLPMLDGGPLGRPDSTVVVGGMEAVFVSLALGQGYTIVAETGLRAIAPHMSLTSIPLSDQAVALSAFYACDNDNPLVKELLEGLKA